MTRSSCPKMQSMFMRVCLGLALFAPIPLWSQTNSGTGATADSADNSQMLIPPTVSDQAYPSAGRAETRSNYLSGGLNVSAAYIDNFYAGNSGPEVSEKIYTFQPSLSLDQTTERQHHTINYSPGYTLYQPSNGLNQVDQNATVSYSYRFAPYVTLSAGDSLRKSSNAFGAADTVSGSPQPSEVGVIAPFVQQLTNNANAELTIQTGRDTMIGFSGTVGTLHFPNTTQSTGLYDSDTRSGSAFYNRRFGSKHYLGLSYGYSDISESPTGTTSSTQTHTISGNYTLYVLPGLSFSVSGGPQYSETAQTGLPTSGSWGPSIMASMGWRGSRASFSANYFRGVSGGGGLLGAFHSNTAGAFLHWQVKRTWSTGVSANYSLNKSVTPLLFLGMQGGHSVSETATLAHALSTHINLDFHYDHVHQNYAGIESIAANPNSNRETLSLSWQFMRPLGQ